MRLLQLNAIIYDMNEYKNYIFDLYGTLLDAHTDERSLKLWKILKDFYNAYGCEWKKKRLRDAFFLYDAGERGKIRATKGIQRPEIQIERVYARLLFEGCSSHPCSFKIAGVGIDELRIRYKTDIDGILSLVASSDWAICVSSLFRTASTNYVRPYKNTFSTLNALKERGCKLYLLSNAQRSYTMPEIEKTGLNEILDKIYISSDYGIMKPEKEFLQTLIKEEGLNPADTVMVGNEIESDIAIALRCGIHSIYLNTFGLKKKDINQRVSEILKVTKAYDELSPLIIKSGDIGEILK